MTKQPTFALVAGEASGDQLGTALIKGLKETYPDARFVGIGGDGMRSAGMDTWRDSKELAVFGLFEVLGHFSRLLGIRRELKEKLLELRPDVFIGIDAPDFNLGLEIKLKAAGIRTVHYVSPTVWAWRSRRVHKIARAADLVMCLFPFEPAFYQGHGVEAVYVGHPMAKDIPLQTDAVPARLELGLATDDRVIALLPGSRSGEVSRLAHDLIATAKLLSEQHPNVKFVAAMANTRAEEIFRSALKDHENIKIELIQGQARTVMAAADVVICASGTATLETMLVNRPMIMVYRLAAPTYFVAKHLKLVNSAFFALPNILANELLIPELLQHEVTAESLAGETIKWLQDENRRKDLSTRFETLHRELLGDSSQQAETAVINLLRSTT
jgi:lipid-A-disaccharide synthase